MPDQGLILAHRRAVTGGIVEARSQLFFPMIVAHIKALYSSAARADYEQMRPMREALSVASHCAIDALAEGEGFYMSVEALKDCHVSAN